MTKTHCLKGNLGTIMTKSSCELLLPYYPKSANVEDLHSTFITNCVINSFLPLTAIMLNIVTIHAIRKASSLQKTLRTLLLSLAVSDLGVGLFVQPFYNSLLVKWLKQTIPHCITYKVFFFIGILVTATSFYQWCCRCKCRQVLGDSSSSQIPGNCNSQARSCCDDRHMGF